MFRVVLVGYSDMFNQILLGLNEFDCDIVGVFRHERKLLNSFFLFFKDIFAPSREKLLINGFHLYEIKAKSINSEKFKKEILKLNPDIIFVASWSEKINKDIFLLPKIACINIHPSLLPKYRGANPYARVIENNEKTSGVTFHLVDEKFDSGAIMLQKEVQISDAETGLSLRKKTSYVARDAVKELLKNMSEGIVVPVQQDEKIATYYPQINENDIIIEINDLFEKISAKLRGVAVWTPCYIPYKNIFFKVQKFIIKDNNYKISENKLYFDGKNLCLATKENKTFVFYNATVFGAIKKIFTPLYLKYYLD